MKQFSTTTSDPKCALPLTRVPAVTLQRKCGCGGQSTGSGECFECQRKNHALQRKPDDLKPMPGRSPLIPPIVNEVLYSQGQPLDTVTRGFQESRFGYDFSGVRVHTNAKAAQSARAVNALAYTVGRDIVFGAEQYKPTTLAGQRLMAHELTHVMQQSSNASRPYNNVQLGEPGDRFETEADAFSTYASEHLSAKSVSPILSPVLQRAMICARPLESSKIAGFFANHAWIDDTGRDDCRGAGLPGNFAVMELVRGTPERGCAAKTDHSPDPSVSTPQGKPCRPRSGVSDIHSCLRTAFNNYASPGFYSTTKGVLPWTIGLGAVGGALGAVGGAALGNQDGTGAAVGLGILGGVLGLAGGAFAGMRIAGSQIGPNSNTFAGTLARACCEDSSDSDLGWVPGWNQPAAGACPAGI